MDIFEFAGAGQYAQPLRDNCQAFGITRYEDQARFLAQVSVESMKFQRVVENLNYRSDTLLRICHGRNGIDSIDDATAVVMRGHDAIANALYGGSWGLAHLGNTEPGDGAKFIGHGLIQLTGRENHRKASFGVHKDDRFITNPELLTLANDAAASACWFWMWKNCNGVPDVSIVTARINGGSEALDRRQAETIRLLAYNP